MTNLWLRPVRSDADPEGLDACEGRHNAAMAGNRCDDTVLVAARPGFRRRRRPRRRLFWRRCALGALALIGVIAAVPPLRRVAALAASQVVLVALRPAAPSVADLEILPQGSKILAVDGTVLADLEGAERRQQVNLSSLPQHVPRAVLAAEDANFYEHAGVDPEAVFRAVVRTGQGDQQGGSTITQQLAKLNYTGSQRTVMRKLREVQYAARLEQKYSKDELLERYMNQVYFGDGAYGIAFASRTFFGKAPAQLTPPEAALLAGKIRAPESLDPRRDPLPVLERRDQVLRLMRRGGALGDLQLAQALATPLRLAPPEPPTSVRAPHFVDYVKREAAGIDELGVSRESRSRQLFTGGYRIETTLDLEAFDAASRAVSKNLGAPGDPEVAMATVQPGDGAIRLLYGGRDQARRFDLASQGRRQPGSSFKPFVYLAALRSGIDPRTTFDASSPRVLDYQGDTYTVDNYEGGGVGASTVDNAMTNSINTVFAQLTLEVGPPNVTRTAETLGVDDVGDNVGSRPAVGLGGLRKGVTPLEQAAAYAAFAANGTYAEPYAIVRIVDRSGGEVYRRRQDTAGAFSANEAGVLNAALQSVVRDGTGVAAALDRPVAGKTGTTQNYGDAWFVGFVPQLSTAVWVGRPDQVVPMLSVHGRTVTGGSFPAQIWADYMREAVAPLPVEEIFVASPDSLSLRIPQPPPPAAPPPDAGILSPVEPPPPPMVTPPASVPTTIVAPPPMAKPKGTTTSTAPTTTTTTTTTAKAAKAAKAGNQ